MRRSILILAIGVTAALLAGVAAASLVNEQAAYQMQSAGGYVASPVINVELSCSSVLNPASFDAGTVIAPFATPAVALANAAGATSACRHRVNGQWQLIALLFLVLIVVWLSVVFSRRAITRRRLYSPLMTANARHLRGAS
jgi:hypothetical protein